jgi:hypothetical protein
MNLKELLKKCTPTPLLVAVGEEYCFHDTTRVAIVKVRRPSKNNPEGSEETVAEVWPGDNDCDIYDAHRFVHAVNILPELVEALEAAWYAMEKHARSECSREIATALAVLKKATTINIEQKGN